MSPTPQSAKPSARSAADEALEIFEYSLTLDPLIEAETAKAPSGGKVEDGKVPNRAWRPAGLEVDASWTITQRRDDCTTYDTGRGELIVVGQNGQRCTVPPAQYWRDPRPLHWLAGGGER